MFLENRQWKEIEGAKALAEITFRFQTPFILPLFKPGDPARVHCPGHTELCAYNHMANTDHTWVEAEAMHLSTPLSESNHMQSQN